MINANLLFRAVRRYAQITKKSRPAFETIFPKPRLLKKILFELDVDHSYGKLLPIYKTFYNALDKPDVNVAVPAFLSAGGLMQMKKVLEKLRRQTKAVNKNLLALENSILDKAADLGDNDAISILVFDTLNKTDQHSEEDVLHAGKLLKNLYESKHPLTTKLFGDLLLQKNDYSRAEEKYMEFLKLQENTELAGAAHEKLGIIHLRKPNLVLAEKHFIRSIELCDLENSVQSHYLLGQIYMDSQPLYARALLEASASKGMKESFAALGAMEYRYFNSSSKAYEWYKLGMELSDINCFLEFLDLSIKTKDWKAVKNCYNSIKKYSLDHPESSTVIGKYLESRRNVLSKFDVDSKATLPISNKSVSQMTQSSNLLDSNATAGESSVKSKTMSADEPGERWNF